MAENEKGLGDLSGLVSSLLSNPAALSGIASLLGNLNSGGATKAHADEKTASATPSAPFQKEEAAPASALPLPQQTISRGDRERRALLCALRPYLSKDKCETLDKLLGLYEIFAIFSSKGR